MDYLFLLFIITTSSGGIVYAAYFITERISEYKYQKKYKIYQKQLEARNKIRVANEAKRSNERRVKRTETK